MMWTLRFLLAVSLTLLAHSPSRADAAAGYFFPNDAIEPVRVSPTGEWVVAGAKFEDRFGVLAQRIGSRHSDAILATPTLPHEIAWIGPDTLIVRVNSLYFQVEFTRVGEAGFSFEVEKFFVRGRLIDALPAQPGIVAWERSQRSSTSLHHASIREVQRSSLRSRGSIKLGNLVARVDGRIVRWILDEDGFPRVAIRSNDEKWTVLHRSSPDDEFVEVASWEPDDESMMQPVGLTRNGDRLLARGFNGEPSVGLHEYDPVSRSFTRVVFQRDDVDLEDVYIDPMTRDILYFTYAEGSATRRHYLPEARQSYVRRLAATSRELDSIDIVSANSDRSRFVYHTSGPTNPGSFFFVNLDESEVVEIVRNGAGIDRKELRELRSFQVPSTDDLEIEALLTMPSRSTPAPLLVMPHGGPIGVHDRQEYDPVVQYFASWGFAVLQANYRGSSGYGRAFEEAGKKQWARGIEDDISAAIDVVSSRADVDGRHICIIGGSYGGFSAVASALRWPKRFDCAVTINGVSDILLMGDSSDFADSQAALETFQEHVGDFEEDRDAIIDASPAYNLASMKTPMLVVYGDEDRRVDRDHAHRVLLMAELYDLPVEEFAIEGAAHSFTREQWIAVLPRIRKFVTRHMLPDAEFVEDPDAS